MSPLRSVQPAWLASVDTSLGSSADAANVLDGLLVRFTCRHDLHVQVCALALTASSMKGSMPF